MKMVITIAASLMITACGGTYLPNGVGMLPDTLQVGKSILSRDTIEPTAYPLLNHDQRTGLAGQLSLEVPDSTQIIGQKHRFFVLQQCRVSLCEHHRVLLLI